MGRKQNLILAIDTSCDDTSVAIVGNSKVLANVIASQTAIHQQYGGVFPTLAKQAHQENIEACVYLAAKRAGLVNNKKINPEKLRALAVTVGPGLAPALEVGIKQAKKLAKNWNLAIIPVNHVEAHALSPLLRPKTSQKKRTVKFPVLSLVISGGHSEFILVKKIGQYQRLGWTVDDSAGECLDKIGRMLNLGYPAAPVLEKLAKLGSAKRWSLPLAMTNVANFNLSFSGLKTATAQLIKKLEHEGKFKKQDVYDLAASIQKQVFAQINYKLEKILLSSNLEKIIYPNAEFTKKIKQGHLQTPITKINEVWLGGGVAANISLRKSLRKTLNNYQKLSGKKISLYLPYHKKFCADNAAMIALTAEFTQMKQKQKKENHLDRLPNLKITDQLI